MAERAMAESATAATAGVQRAVGVARLMMRRSGARTVLDRLYQAGPLRLRLPKGDAGFGKEVWPEAVLLNTAGGIAGGDSLSVAVEAGPDARLTVSTQGAERVYRARPEDAPARLETRFTVQAGAMCEYLPQETILFEGSALERRLEIDLAGDGAFLGVESLVLGRKAMGESLERVLLSDTITVRRQGMLVLRDALRLPDALGWNALAALRRRRACLDGVGALATVLLAGAEAESCLDGLRDVLAVEGIEAGASAWNGILLARILAPDGARLKEALVRALTCLRPDRALPRVWLC